MLNWLIGKLCAEPRHIPMVRYVGMFKYGFVCQSCGYQWYQDRKYIKPATLIPDDIQ